jgi:PAS domain S-box-containing protein
MPVRDSCPRIAAEDEVLTIRGSTIEKRCMADTPAKSRLGDGAARSRGEAGSGAVARDDRGAPEGSELRHAVRDLVALSTLPAIWSGDAPDQIADAITAALIAMLDPEFVYISLNGRAEEPVVALARTGDGRRLDATEAFRDAMAGVVGEPPFAPVTEIPNPVGDGRVRVVAAPIGLGRGERLLAGSRRTDFPTETQHLLLTVAASQAAVAMRRWRAETDERRFAALVEGSSDFIGFATPGGVPQYINPAGMELVGLRRVDQGRHGHIMDFVAPEDRERARKEFWPQVMPDGRWTGEFRFRHLETGEAIPVLLDWFRIDEPRTGRAMNIATVTRDLTAQKRSDAELRHLNETLERRVAERTIELEEANRRLRAESAERQRADARLQQLQSELFHAARLSAMGQMAAALAHELNQPLTAANNFIRTGQRLLAKGDVDAAEAREVMGEAADQVLRAGQIISRLRTFVTRADSEKRVESVPHMVEEASALALSGTGGLGLAVRFAFDPAADRAFADRIQVQQVLVNLIRNAVEALAHCERRDMAITTARLDPSAIEIAVIDSGPGIADEVLERLFEPFVSTKRNGMGVGLSICRTIIEAHGGRLWAEPGVEKGASFLFTLPLARRMETAHE